MDPLAQSGVGSRLVPNGTIDRSGVLDQAYTIAVVTLGMVAAVTAGWRAGTLMSPRPPHLRAAAWRESRARERRPTR